MMQRAIIVLMIFCILSCNDKKTIYPEKLDTKNSAKFDLKKFNENKIDSTYEYVLKDTIIRLYEEKDFYKKELIANNHSFNHVFGYNKTTNSLVNEFCYFFRMPIGVWKSYNEKGSLINWKNYDEGFDFTIKELIVKLKKDFQIDLINDTNYQLLTIDRFSYKRLYFITSYCYLLEIASMDGTRIIKIDGETGEILSDEKSFIEE